jgi:hypothetical protein
LNKTLHSFHSWRYCTFVENQQRLALSLQGRGQKPADSAANLNAMSVSYF